MTRYRFGHMCWQGVRHEVAEPSRQERRVRRLLRIAGRAHAAGLRAWDHGLDRHIELTGSQREPAGEER